MHKLLKHKSDYAVALKNISVLPAICAICALVLCANGTAQINSKIYPHSTQPLALCPKFYLELYPKEVFD